MSVEIVRPTPVETPINSIHLVNPIIQRFECDIESWKKHGGGRKAGFYLRPPSTSGKRIEPLWDMVIEGEANMRTFIEALTELAAQQGVVI
jgi:hypothetical protein